MLSTSELKARASKLQREQEERAERARRKAERERLAQERVRQKKAALEDHKRQIREEQRRAELEAEERRAAEIEANNGVVWHGLLTAVPFSTDIAKEKGIKRAGDKLLLPASVGAELMRQDAPRNGAMLFELGHPNGRTTHAGLLEYTAPEGTVALPTKVLRCLWGPDAVPEECFGRISVKYRRLPKGTFVRLQPRSALFQSEVGEDIKPVLENALHGYCTLSVGDWLEVADATGVTWELRVKELEPETAVSIIDTDLEAQLDPSVETEERIRAEEEAARQRLEALAALKEEEERAAAAAAARAKEDAEAALRAAEAAAQAAERVRASKEAALPAEPPEADASAVTCVVRLPDGSRCSRRFAREAPLQVVYDFVDARGAGGQPPGSYQLVTLYPRRVFAPEKQGESLQELGLDAGQQVLMVEPVA